MELVLKVASGIVSMSITRHDGLTFDTDEGNEPARRNDYVLKFVEPDAAHALYVSMDVSNPLKVDHLVASMPAGLETDVPFLDLDPGDHLCCTNDAHVLEALYRLGVNPIPVVINYRHASRI